MGIIAEEILRNKRLKKLRLVLSRLEGIQQVEDADGGRSVEWKDLETERERKIAVTYFWDGFEFAEEYRKMEEALRGEIE